ncbi:hypothetical protein [Pseudomonas putida]
MPRHTLTPQQLQRLGRSGIEPPPHPMQSHPWVFPQRPASQPPTQASPGLLQVLPLSIPNADSITPEGYDGAVNIALRETLPEGVLADVYYSSPRILDTVEVFWGDQDVPVASQSFDQVPTLPVRVFIPTDRIEEGEFLASCQVTAVGQSAERSAMRKYLVKLSRPGGNDTDAEEPGNQNMARAQLPQHIIDNGVGPGDAAAGVPVTIAAWDAMALHDTCELHWGSETLTQRVENTAEIGRDMVFQVGADTIRDAWDDVSLNVTYKLVDRVNNSSRDSEERPWAPTTYVEVYANDSSLYEPWVEEAGRDQETIDLDTLVGSPVHVEVDIERNSPYAEGTCTLIWRGITADGTAVVHTEDLDVSRAPMALYFEVPSAVVEQIRGGRVVVYYTLSKDGNSDHSARNSLDVIGQPLAWPAPEALDLNGDDELPIDIPFARFSTPVYDSKSAGDIIVLHVSGTSLDGQVVNYESPAYPVIEGEQDQPLVITLPGDQLAPLDGSQATVFYKVNPNTAQERTSDYLTVNVGVGSSQLRAPTVLQAVEGWFNPADYPGGATLSVPRGPLQQGDKVSYYWRGSVTPVYTSWNTAGPSGPVLFEISPDLITPNLNGTVTAWYTVERGGSVVGTSPELLLNIGEQQVEWPAPVVIDASGDPVEALNPIYEATEENTATLSIADNRLRKLDVIAPVWRLREAGDLTVPWVEVSVAGTVNVPVPRAVLGASINAVIEVSYVVFRQGTPLGSSQIRVLRVLNLLEQTLPAPTILEAVGGTLDVTALSADAHVRVAAWPFINADQHYWLDVSGTLSDGTAVTINLAANEPVTPETEVERRLSLAWLQALKNATSLVTTMRVAFRPGATAVNFPSSAHTVHTIVDTRPVITRVRDSKGDLENDGSTFEGGLTLTGTATASQQVEVLADSTSKGHATVNDSGTWNFDMTGLVAGRHLITAKAQYGAGLVSEAWPVNVIADVRPEITSVQDAVGTVINGGTTPDTALTLTGTALANQQVEIFDGATSRGSTGVNSAGVWTVRLASVAVGQHSFTAQSLYGAGLMSNNYAVSVRAKAYTDWTFSDGTFQGWAPNGAYLGDISVQWSPYGFYYLVAATPGYADYSGVVISRVVFVERGRTYRFVFQTQQVDSGPLNNLTRLCVVVDNSRVGDYLIPPFTGRGLVTGLYTATSTGSITLGTWNSQASGGDNDFYITRITMEEL